MMASPLCMMFFTRPMPLSVRIQLSLSETEWYNFKWSSLYFNYPVHPSGIGAIWCCLFSFTWSVLQSHFWYRFSNKCLMTCCRGKLGLRTSLFSMCKWLSKGKSIRTVLHLVESVGNCRTLSGSRSWVFELGCHVGPGDCLYSMLPP